MNEEITKKKSHLTLKILAWVGVICVIVAVVGFIYYQFQTITQKNSQITVLNEQNATLEQGKQSLNKSIDEITGTINEIAVKLQDVRQKHVVITNLIARSTEGTQKEKILIDINAIEVQLERDKRDIDDLTQKIQVSGIKMKSLENLVGNMRKEIIAYIGRIENLRSIVEAKNEIIRNTENTLDDTKQTLAIVENELDESTQELSETRNTLEEVRNTAYYMIGTKKELKEKNVIDEEGWFMFNKDVNLSTEIDEQSFNKIDIIQQNEFPIACSMKHVRILPERSASSYKIQETGENQSLLKVTNPENFWKVKYMAVLIKG